MKVKELIQQLSSFDPELEVIINRFDGFKNHKDKLEEDAVGLEYGVTTYHGEKLEICLAID